MTAHEPSQWLDGTIRAAIDDHVRCPHQLSDPTPARPALLVLRLGMLACSECAPLFTTRARVPVCDRCGKRGPVQVAYLHAGPTHILFGLCAPCMRREIPAAPAPTPASPP